MTDSCVNGFHFYLVHITKTILFDLTIITVWSSFSSSCNCAAFKQSTLWRTWVSYTWLYLNWKLPDTTTDLINVYFSLPRGVVFFTEGSQLTPRPAWTDPWSEPGTPAERDHELHCEASRASNLIQRPRLSKYNTKLFFFHDVSKIEKRTLETIFFKNRFSSG